MKQLVIGMGEVGKAVYEVLNDALLGNGSKFQTGWQDIEKRELHFAGNPQVLHVCFPYSSAFVDLVKGYELKYAPLVVIIHSTVPVGTCDLHRWTHSPIRGVHPNIADGIRKFTKFFGGRHAELGAHIFSCLGVRTVALPFAKECEAAKIWDTTQYGWMIMLCKEIKGYCDANDLDFEVVYTQFNKTYNEGYERLGREEVVRPFLKFVPGPIGGHCVIPNLEFLPNSEFAIELKRMNDLLIENMKSLV